MPNELEKVQPASPAAYQQSSASIQTAEKIVNVEKAGMVKTEITVNHYGGGIPGMPSTEVPKQTQFNHDYYNLLVYGGEPFFGTDDSRNHVTLAKKTCLESTATDEEVRNRYCSLSAEAIEEIKTFPALIAYENTAYGKTGPDHYACFGQITDIKNRSNGIEIYFHPIYGFQQQPLNELLFELGLYGNNRFNELNHSHWTIKQIDLVEVLTEHGLLKEW